MTEEHKSNQPSRDIFASQSKALSLNSSFAPQDFSTLHEELKEYWSAALFDLSHKLDKSLTDSWFEKLYHQHNEEGRFYHTAVHLKEILEYWTIVLNLSDQTMASLQPAFDKAFFTRVISWATFFHDAIYNPRSSQNERDSAKLFQEFCSEVLNSNELGDSKALNRATNLVIILIQATEKHKLITDPSMTTAEVGLQKLFLDLDMAVLGKQQEAYLAYAGLIRKEYAFVERSMYCEKRAEILTGFLNNQKRIFLSDLFHQTMEDQARNNLKEEIALLKSGIIPGEGK